MSDMKNADATTRSALLELEARRQTALQDVDLETLNELFDDSLVHIHAPGLMHSKEQLLEHVATRQPYISTLRGEVNIRVAGDVAVMTGALVNQLRSPEGGERTVGGVVTQVAVRGADSAWRFASFQMTPAGEHSWPVLNTERDPRQLVAETVAQTSERNPGA